MKIPHSKPTINTEDIAAVEDVLKSGHLACGAQVESFEKKLSRCIGVKGGVAVNCGTSALHLALLALGIGPGDQVFVPSFSCSALLNAVIYAGAKPVAVDVNEDDFNISAVEVKKKVNPKIRAIIVPHIFGAPADLKALGRIGVPIIEDCAQSLGATYEGRMTGSSGVLSICSFYATKILTTGEGGMVLSDSVKLLDKVRDLREYDNVSSHKVRFNYKMTDFQAALGVSQLSRLSRFLQKRKFIAQTYTRALAGLPLITPAGTPGHVYFRYVLKTRHQEKLLRHLRQKGIEASCPVFKPLHRYVRQSPCPVTEKLMRLCVSIPIYPALTDVQVRYIIRSIPGFYF